MKKYLLVGLIVFFKGNIIAQNKRIIGNWKENYHMIADTTSNGMEEINANPEAYRKGNMKLSSEYIDYREVHPESDSEKWQISITKEQDVFWVSDGDLKEKLVYAPKTNNYYVNLNKLWKIIKGNLTVEYDDKSQKILFIDEKLKMAVFEFSRK
nr:hypothetical protein [uncultured Flavobacterium sp.]